jgi:RNase P subunit RPR2
MVCPKCESHHLTTIVIRLAPGEEHLFASCHGCEWRGWFKEGSAVPLEQVLSLASERRF